MTRSPAAVPTAVVFDLGKVLVDFDYTRAAGRLALHSERPAREIQALIDQSPLLYRLETGAISNEEFFAEVQTAIGFRGGLAEFAPLFADIFTAIAPMVELHERLRASGVPTFIFSNTNGLAVRHIRATFPFFSRFDDYVFSFEHRAMKPEDRLYEVVESRTGRSGGALLYVDDRPENVAAGWARGWRVVHHETPEQTISAVRAAGLLGSAPIGPEPCAE